MDCRRKLFLWALNPLERLKCEWVGMWLSECVSLVHLSTNLITLATLLLVHCSNICNGHWSASSSFSQPVSVSVSYKQITLPEVACPEITTGWGKGRETIYFKPIALRSDILLSYTLKANYKSWLQLCFALFNFNN